jgi:hypothetical protein
MTRRRTMEERSTTDLATTLSFYNGSVNAEKRASLSTAPIAASAAFLRFACNQHSAFNVPHGFWFVFDSSSTFCSLMPLKWPMVSSRLVLVLAVVACPAPSLTICDCRMGL